MQPADPANIATWTISHDLGVSSKLPSGTAASCVSMNGKLRSHSAGGNGPHSGLLRNLTPVYKMIGVSLSSTMQQPEKQPSASAPPGVGSKAGGMCSQCTKSELAA